MFSGAAANDWCDGQNYILTLTANHKTFYPDYKVTWSMTVDVKYDCTYLVSQEKYAIPATPTLVIWPGGLQSRQRTNTTVYYKIETDDSPQADVSNPLVHGAQTYNYSCFV
jgi:hypothetical protein